MNLKVSLLLRVSLPKKQDILRRYYFYWCSNDKLTRLLSIAAVMVLVPFPAFAQLSDKKQTSQETTVATGTVVSSTRRTLVVRTGDW